MFTIVKEGIPGISYDFTPPRMKEECASLFPALTAPLLVTMSNSNAVGACCASINLSAMSGQTFETNGALL